MRRLRVDTWLILLTFAVMLSACIPNPAQQVIDMTPTPTQLPELEEPQAQPRSYIPYSLQAFEAAEGRRRVYFFHANWCPTCKVANEDFEANAAQIPADVVVLKTNYDTESALKQEYDITYQHTFVQVDENGNQVTTWSGGGVEELINNLI
jgi:thioredoxin 1